MSDSVIVGIISGSAALLGILSGSVIEYFRHKRDDRKSRYEKKEQAYKNLICSFQSYMNQSSSANLLTFQNSVNVVCLIGAHAVLAILIPYYQAINGHRNDLCCLEAEQKERYHANIQNKLIKAIRLDLGEKNEGLPETPIYGAREI